MSRLAAIIGGVVPVLVGSCLLLFALPSAFIQPRNLHGVGYGLAVIASIFTLPTGRLAVGGLGLIVGGVALNLRTAFPEGSDMPMSTVGRVGLFWALVFAGTLALVGVLVGITLSTLGLG